MATFTAGTVVLGTSEGLRAVGGTTTSSSASASPCDVAALQAGNITALSACDGVVWALVAGAELWRVDGDGAQQVARLEPDKTEDRARRRHVAGAGTCLLADGADVWVGSDGAHLFRLDGDRLQPVDSFDEAPTQSEWHTPWGGPAATRSMAAGHGFVFVNVHVGGILRSPDGGRTWQDTIDLHDDVHQVSMGSDGRLWAATGASALAHSDDDGRTWAHHREGLHGRYLRAVAPVTDGVLVTASSGPGATDGAVYRFDGDRFERCTMGIPADFGGNVDTHLLAAGHGVTAVAGLDGRLYVSGDGGRGWQVEADGLPPVRAAVIT